VTPDSAPPQAAAEETAPSRCPPVANPVIPGPGAGPAPGPVPAVPPTRSPSASACEPYRELIELGLARGRNAMPIWQDLVSESGFPSSYQSVKRFIHRLRGPPVPEARPVIVTAPGEEPQVDYGTGPQRTVGCPVTLASVIAGNGPSAVTPATAVTTIVGSTRRVTSQVPASIVVPTPTAHTVSISSTTSTGIAFASGNKASLMVNPPASISSLSPNSAQAGTSVQVTITGGFYELCSGRHPGQLQ
jgi:hypothetical protein